MPRLLARSVRILLDAGVISIAYWTAWLFRFEFSIPDVALPVALMTWPLVAALHFAAMIVFGVTRVAWRYVNIRDAERVLIAVASATLVLAGLRFLRWVPYTNNLLPTSVLAMDFVLTFVGLVGVRSSWRIHREVQARKLRARSGARTRVLLVGAGEAGVMVAREIANRPDVGLEAVGFIDDDPLKLNTVMGGLQVLGSTADLARIADHHEVNRVLITIANAPGAQIRRISGLCQEAKLETRIIPGMYEIVGDHVNVSRARAVQVQDLLGRDPVKLDEDMVRGSLRSRVVLVTGAGGSIGSELCRQICQFGPGRLILVERFENALFEIHRELTVAFPQVQIDPRVADICDAKRMAQLFEHAKPEIVFHAAAHKHVPMMEWNPGEAVKNNVGGTLTLATLADRYGVERFVLVSTDKAVNPTSVMGATKRVAEILVQAFSQKSATRFVTVRFGNVLGSNGSVVPIFKQQIAAGGPVLVTHPEMRRYFMTIPEASQLVMQAGAMGDGGEIFILDMGEPVKIVDLARDLIRLSGLRPDDIEIRYTGIRPGEKLFEELSTSAEGAEKTRHPKVFIGRIKSHPWESVSVKLDRLLEVAFGTDADSVRAAIGDLVPEYAIAHPSSRKTSPRGERTVRDDHRDDHRDDDHKTVLPN